MKVSLSKKLVERGIIRPGTEIEALYEALDLSGVHRTECRDNFVIMSIKGLDEPVFEIAARDGRRKRIGSAAIIKIDGMEPGRLASIYNIKPDGSDKPPGKRRGRKPKVRVDGQA
jgi:hypothetical protein